MRKLNKLLNGVKHLCVSHEEVAQGLDNLGAPPKKKKNLQ